MNKCLAHINGVDVLPHYLYTHLECVSEIISTNSLSVELVEIFRFAGKYHDLGKYQDEFQNYLTNGGVRGSVRHAIWGAFHAKKENCIAAIFAIAGHHAGLHNYGEISHVLQYECDEKHYNYIINKFQTENHLSSISEGALNAFNSIPTVLEKELFVRYLFSCLVDADWLDTEKYFNEDIAELRAHSSFDAGELSKKLNDYMSNFSLDGELNILRNKVRLEAEKSATKATGFYSLSLPTGVGKTLCSLNWAVKHAMHNSKKRIIIVLPFISIIDQTASILKTIFGEDYVLEHHSNYLPESANDEVYFVKKLATENWDYPIVITTSVQFFESLFSNRPSKCRKLHNIKDSVVIFDEVQTLPMKYITPTLTMLNNLNTLMRTSFLFCTATQPAFETREGFEGIDNITPLVNDLDAIYKATERVIYKSVNSYE